MFKNKLLRTNLIFWTCWFLYEWLANAAYDSNYKFHLIQSTLLLPLLIGATLFTIFVLIKQFYSKGKKVEFYIGLVSSILFFGIARRAINYFVIYPPEWRVSQAFLFPPKIIFEIAATYLVVGLNAMFYFLQAWYEQQQIAQTLQKDKAEVQLELLKSQVQPHFIFNTLNNIYSLSTQNSPKTPDLIYRLSSLLSYSLYDSRRAKISLEQELEYIRNYIELEKIRYGERLDISVNVLNDIGQISIAPFLLLPIVENCFKHGASNEIDECWIRLDVLYKDDWLIIKAENSKPCSARSNGTHNGIGLENVRQRLEILYPASYELKCMEDEQSYLAVLKIKMIAHEDQVLVGG
ncbi:sensor histidine kinase [Paraflavitalea pollutisoli]|uniref:sensor histidine kinase n=1 Tax=Paraflavitalea pollutisoli TaxID=3034143 RepID=UPI0023ED6597|nr:histidine kinase [Paraflavitalea sp. H1-2-19X]